AFGLVAVPGLLFAVLMFFVRDYENPPLATEQMNSNRFSQWSGYLKEMFRKPVLWLVYLGSAIQFFVIATIGNWMPSFFNRVYGLPADQAGVRSALLALCSAFGVMVGGWFADRVIAGNPCRRLWLP
ncbi:MFS transporter, partial [Enterobacter hormaechei]